LSPRLPSRRVGLFGLFGLFVLFAPPLVSIGCGPPPDPATPGAQPRLANPAWGNACTAKNDEADLMGWDAGSRANVALMRRQGVLAVRFTTAPTDGCKVTLELIPNCIGDGAYAFAPYPANEKRIAHDQTELGAKLPLFSLDVGGKLTTGRALRTDFDLAGMAALPVAKPFARRDLHGQGCDRATHVVSRVYLGGFAIMVGESRSIEATASVFGAGVQASNVRDAEQLATEGDPEACKVAQRSGTESPSCSVPLRLALMPINDATAADYAAANGKKPNLDDHGCVKGRQLWNGRTCEELKLDPNGHELLDSLQLNAH
jgi:hypothetical protein